MEQGTLTLKIYSPQKSIFEGVVERVSFPGAKAPFTILRNHAPMISVLERGFIRWGADAENEVAIAGGFVEIKDNVVTACVEI